MRAPIVSEKQEFRLAPITSREKPTLTPKPRGAHMPVPIAQPDNG